MFNKFSKKSFLRLSFLGFFILVFSVANLTLASPTVGTINTTNKYAWGENIGWLNFACDGCNVVITNNSLSGYAWSEQYGWINLNPSTSGVTNNAQGILSGYAWSTNLGWINFAGVSIDSNGNFLGYATIKSDNSRINFNCINADSCNLSNFKVTTDWRPGSVPSGGGGGGGGGYIAPPTPPTPPSTFLPVFPDIITPIIDTIDNIKKVVKVSSNFFLDYFKPKNKDKEVIVQIPKIAPFSFKAQWNLLPVEAIRQFVFAPLPYEVQTLASKFPELDKTFKDVGIKRLTDLSKLSGVTLNLPGLSQLNNTLKDVGVKRLTDLDKLSGVTLDIPGLSNINGEIINSVGTGKIALIKGLPVADFPLFAKKNLPTEFVFARANGELVDLNVAISIGETGKVTQKMSSLPGKKMRLVVKPISKARSVTGYFVFKSATPKITQRVSPSEISRSSLVASALFSLNDLVEENPEPIENKLVLSSFEYTDADNDGIYIADVEAPVVPGEYEVITVIDYIDPVLGTRQMRMITVIDPEGYVFEKNNGKETRIPSAVVSLFYLNTATKKYELWAGKNYQQENPQTTDIRGTYSFLVPEGSYYFDVIAPGYDFFESKVFVVTEGSGIHQNIELKSSRGFFFNFDLGDILLFVVLLLLMYNLYRNRLRDKLLKQIENQNDRT